jgi:hypothetical protein
MRRLHRPRGATTHMADAVAKPIHFQDVRFAGWLLVALLVHSSLLLIPLQGGLPPAQSLQRLTVSLQRIARPQRADPQPMLPEQSVPPAAPPLRDAAVPADVEPTPPNSPAAPASPPPALSAARLFDLASRQEWSLKSPTDTRDLGVFRPQPLPENWRRGMPLDANRFDGMIAPDEVEVVDRWLAADGSHNVVVNTPSGDTYCGRAEAWSPLNPLFEPIMMWRACGGGGKRSFEMPEPYRKGSNGAELR